jgi:cell division protein FtsW
MSASHSLTSFFARTDRSAIARWWWTVDKPMLACLIILMVVGVALVTSASPSVATRIGVDHAHFITRHIIFVIPSFLIMLGVSVLDHLWIRRVGTLVFLFMVFMMILVPFVGPDIKGAQRWINLAGFSLQPSEFIKPAFAIVVAWLITYQKQNSDFKGNIFCALIYALVVFLLMSQPDFGMTTVLTFMFASQIFMAGLPLRYLFVMALIAVIGVVCVYYSFGHVRDRMDKFLNPHGTADTYQVDKSLEAFSNGGFFGQGPGQGSVKNSIPDVHADFIFAVSGEELGLLVTLALVGVYAFVLLRGFGRLMESNDMFVVLAAGGILSVFGLQAFVHMGSSLHILPTKGMTLPFISYGGSSILAMGFGMGVVLGLTRREARTSIARRGLSLASRLRGE